MSGARPLRLQTLLSRRSPGQQEESPAWTQPGGGGGSRSAGRFQSHSEGLSATGPGRQFQSLYQRDYLPLAQEDSSRAYIRGIICHWPRKTVPELIRSQLIKQTDPKLIRSQEVEAVSAPDPQEQSDHPGRPLSPGTGAPAKGCLGKLMDGTCSEPHRTEAE